MCVATPGRSRANQDTGEHRLATVAGLTGRGSCKPWHTFATKLAGTPGVVSGSATTDCMAAMCRIPRRGAQMPDVLRVKRVLGRVLEHAEDG